MLRIERIYQSKADSKTYRVLVDRLWPRGVSKEKAQLDLWAKEIAPSTDLRKWFNHERDKFAEFSRQYNKELDENPNLPVFIAQIREQLKQGDVILLYGAKDEVNNQAQVLLTFLKAKLGN